MNKLSVELRCVLRDDAPWQELWINGRSAAEMPLLMDGNQVALEICDVLRKKYKIDAQYTLTDLGLLNRGQKMKSDRKLEALHESIVEQKANVDKLLVALRELIDRIPPENLK